MEKIVAQSLTIGETTIKGPANMKLTGVSNVITEAIPFVFAAAGIGLLMMIIMAGFTLLTSAGDAKKMEAGKSRLTNALVGFIVVFVAYWIVQLLGIALGIESISSIFGGSSSSGNTK